MKVLNRLLQLLVVCLCVCVSVLAETECACPNFFCKELSDDHYGYNLSARPECQDRLCVDFFDHLSGRLDVLWWKPSEEGLALGTIAHERGFRTATVENSYFDTHTLNPNFKYNAGFRLGIGYFSPCNCWDLVLNWTNYHSKASVAYDQSTELLGTVFISDWEIAPNFFPILAQAHWSLNLDLVDCELAYRYYVSPCCILRPYLGLRAGRIDQTYRVTSTVDSESPSELSSVIKSTCIFNGIGPRLGLDLEFAMGCGFSVVGQAAGSLLYGKYHRGSHEVASQPPIGTNPAQITHYDADVGEPRSCSMAVTDVMIGLKWESCFRCCDTSHPFSFLFAWEQHGFYNSNQFNYQPLPSSLFTLSNPENEPRKRGDMTLQGFTFSVLIGF